MKFNQIIPELGISDFKNSLKFYTDVIGFAVEYKREEEGFAFLSLGKCQLMIDEIGKSRTWKTANLERPLGRGVNFQIRVKSIAPIIKNLSKNKIKIFRGPEDRWYRINNKEVGNRQFLVQDPDGYLLRFYEDLGTKPLQLKS